MISLTVDALTATHHGTTARVVLPDGTSHEGTLSFARNPSYHRREVRHWWLIVPSASKQFTHDAISLQWAGSATVHLLNRRNAA